MFKLRDKLSGRKECFDESQSQSILYCYSGKNGYGAGSDDIISNKGHLLFEKDDNLEEMRSAEDITYN